MLAKLQKPLRNRELSVSWREEVPIAVKPRKHHASRMGFLQTWHIRILSYARIYVSSTSSTHAGTNIFLFLRGFIADVDRDRRWGAGYV
jgi:hypothetical protein